MNEWINQVINSNSGSATIIIASFLLGFIATFASCCNYAIIGSVAGYATGFSVKSTKKQIFSFNVAFFIGSVFSLALVGALIGYIGASVAEVIGSYWKLLSAIILIIFGLLSFGLIPIKLPSINYKSEKKGFVPGLILGLIAGGITMSCSACCNPVLPILLGAAFIKASIIWGVIILVAFAIGHTIPYTIAIAGIQLSFAKFSDSMKNAGKIITYIAGVVMLLAGFYLIFTY